MVRCRSIQLQGVTVEKIHKALTLKQLRSLGYEGWYERALCNPSNILGNVFEDYREGYTWKKVNCKGCLKKKRKANV